MFKGITSTTIDAKARITIPTEYRDAIKAACGGQIVVTVDVDRCLLIYPQPEWERFETDLRALPNVGKQVRRWHRLYLGHAKPREIDGQHRILLPQELRDYAGLKKHESIEQYAQIKSTIYKNATHKVIPRDKRTKSFLSDYQTNLSFGSDVPSGNNYGVMEDESGRWLVRGDRKIIQSSELSLLGSPGELNVLAALALTQSFIKDETKALGVIKRFKGLSHRCELIAEHNHVNISFDHLVLKILDTAF